MYEWYMFNMILLMIDINDIDVYDRRNASDDIYQWVIVDVATGHSRSRQNYVLASEFSSSREQTIIFQFVVHLYQIRPGNENRVIGIARTTCNYSFDYVTQLCFNYSIQ
jgi:hypothetical protein